MSSDAQDRIHRALTQDIVLMNVLESKRNLERNEQGPQDGDCSPVLKKSRVKTNHVCAAQKESSAGEGAQDDGKGDTLNLLLPLAPPEEIQAVQFFVQGTSVDMYIVSFTQTSPHHPTCACPDFQRRAEPCKHIYYVVFKILFTDIAKQGTEEHILQIAHRQCGAAESGAASELWAAIVTAERKRQTTPLLGPKTDVDTCSICFDDMDPKNIKQVSWCSKECRTPFHRTCMDIWLQTNHTCPMCRKDWAKWRGGMRMGGRNGWR